MPVSIRNERRLRLLAACLASAWLWAWYQRLWLSQLQSPPLISPGADNTLWLLHWTGLPDLLLGNAGAGLDLLLTATLALGLWRPRLPVWAALWWGGFTLYLLCLHSAMTHHAHQAVGLWATGLVLTRRTDKGMDLACQALRYYACLTMTSAALWKIARGAWLNPDQMLHTLQMQHIDLLASGQEGNYERFLLYLMQHPLFCQILWTAAVLLQASFVLGFFTRRFDRWFVVLLFTFFFADFVLMHLNFIEFCIFACFFLFQYPDDSPDEA